MQKKPSKSTTEGSPARVRKNSRRQDSWRRRPVDRNVAEGNRTPDMRRRWRLNTLKSLLSAPCPNHRHNSEYGAVLDSLASQPARQRIWLDNFSGYDP